MSEILERTGWGTLREDFEWDIPATFNFGADVVDFWARNGDGVALVWGDDTGARQRFRFSDISRLSNRIANSLTAAGIKKGDRVIVLLPRIPHWQIALVACMKVGAIPIPCIEMQTEKDLTFRVEHSGAVGVIARAEHAGKFTKVQTQLNVCVAIGEFDGWHSWDDWMDQGGDEFVPVEMAADDPAIMYYTSGSTGNPKGVLHRSGALFAWKYCGKFWLDLKPGEVMWCTADTGWSKAGTSVLFGPWGQGACSAFYDGRFDPRKRIELIAEFGVSVFCASATELYKLVNEDISGFDLSKLRRAVTGGESLSAAVANAFRQKFGINVYEGYGQTETLMTIYNHIGDEPRIGAMGRAQPGVDIDVLGDDNGRAQDNVVGRIAMRLPNPQMMITYWKNEEGLQDRIVEGPDGKWFVTGDLGSRDAESYIWYKGRDDDIISSAGYRIGPVEVEAALLTHPAVQECAVIGSPDEERGEIVKGFVVLRSGIPGTEGLVKELQDHCKQATAPYKYPRAIEFVDDLPKTMTGKIQRKTLRDQERLAASGNAAAASA